MIGVLGVGKGEVYVSLSLYRYILPFVWNLSPPPTPATYRGRTLLFLGSVWERFGPGMARPAPLGPAPSTRPHSAIPGKVRALEAFCLGALFIDRFRQRRRRVWVGISASCEAFT